MTEYHAPYGAHRLSTGVAQGKRRSSTRVLGEPEHSAIRRVMMNNEPRTHRRTEQPRFRFLAHGSGLRSRRPPSRQWFRFRVARHFQLSVVGYYAVSALAPRS